VFGDRKKTFHAVFVFIIVSGGKLEVAGDTSPRRRRRRRRRRRKQTESVVAPLKRERIRGEASPSRLHGDGQRDRNRLRGPLKKEEWGPPRNRKQ
jgi:hypothetical protein